MLYLTARLGYVVTATSQALCLQDATMLGGLHCPSGRGRENLLPVSGLEPKIV